MNEKSLTKIEKKKISLNKNPQIYIICSFATEGIGMRGWFNKFE
jgi:hypothetical protein